MNIEKLIDYNTELTNEDRSDIYDHIQSYIDACEKSSEMIAQYGGIDGNHHKQWVINEIIKLIEGDHYVEWVKDWEFGKDGPNTYEWDEGIAP